MQVATMFTFSNIIVINDVESSVTSTLIVVYWAQSARGATPG